MIRSTLKGPEKRTPAVLIALLLLTLPAFGQEYLMGSKDTVKTCGGFFLDSGGQNGNYSPGENYTMTICSGDSTAGSHVQLIFPNTGIVEGDLLCFYDGPNTSAPRLSCSRDFNLGAPFIIQATAANPSGCLTITFRSDATGQDKGWAADINCVPACQLIQSELVSTTPAVEPADTGWLDACAGQRLVFSGKGSYPQNGLKYQHSDQTSTFTWSFGDGTSAVGPEVSKIYRRSGGFIVQLTITDQLGCRSTNFISQRVRISTRPDFTLAGDLPAEICAGDTVQVDAVVNKVDSTKVLSAVPTEGSFQFGGTRSDSLALPDGTGAAYETSIEFKDFQPGQVLTNVNDLQSICVNMEHSWMRDLQISIMCPSGKSVLLHDHRGQVGGSVFLGEPNDYDDAAIRPGKGYDYCWTPNASRPNWLDYSNTNLPRTLPAGDYQSVQPFSQLLGCPLNGEWTIRVQDLWGQDNGFIFSWSINFNPDLFPNLETFTPSIVNYGWESAPAELYRTIDSLAAAPVHAGQACYLFQVTDDFGCKYDTLACVKVLPPSHPKCVNCGDNLGPVRDTALCQGQSAQLNVRSSRPLTDTITFESFPRRTFGFTSNPPTQPYNASIDVNSVAPPTLTDPVNQIASVCVNIETGWAGDIDIYLRSPTGALLELSTRNGGEDDNYTKTCFSPKATAPITGASAPFTGTFRPEGDWNVLRNSPLTGNWSIVVSDALGAEETNRLLQWSITFNSTNSIQYSWTPAAGLSCTNCPNPIARPGVTTNYVVKATDNYGCVAQDTLTVGIVSDALPPQVECSVSNEGEITFFWIPKNVNDRYEMRLTRLGVTGPWQPVGRDQNTLVVSGLRRREELTLELRYYLGGVNPVGCTVKTTKATCAYQPCNFEVRLAEAPKGASCYGVADGSVRVLASGGDPPYTYSLDSSGIGRDTGFFNNLLGGRHFIVVRDTGLCGDTLRFEVPQPDSLNLQLAQLKQGCPGTNKNQVNAIAAGGTAPYAFRWSDGQPTAAAVNLDSLSYSVTLTDANGCSTNGSILVRDLPGFNPNIIQSSPTCFGYTDGKLGVNFVESTVSEDPADYTYRWSTGGIGPIVERLAGGQTYTVTVTDVNGCAVVVERELKDPPQISFEFQKEDILCAGDRKGSATVVNIRGENNRYTFKWDAATGNQTAARADNLTAGTFRVTVTDEKNCSQSGSVTLQQPSPLDLQVKKQDNPCFGDEKGSIELSIRGGKPAYTIRWSSGANTSSISKLRAGSYSLSITDGNGCLTTDTIAITQPALLQAELTGEPPTCTGFRDGMISIRTQGGTLPYLFSLDNQNFSGANVFVGLKAAAYQVYVRDGKGCLFTDRLRLDDPPPFSVDAGLDQTIILGDSIILKAGSLNGEGVVEYVWSAPYEGTLSCAQCPNPIARTFNTITYELNGTDDRGCEDNDFITINVDKPRVLEVPTGFSPNSDGENDLLLVHGRRGTRITIFQVFDRWGELVYESGGFLVNDPNAGWDGTFRGQPMNTGVYIWYVEVEYIDGAKDVFKGQTTLIR